MARRRCVLEKVIAPCLALGISSYITGCGGGGGGGSTTTTTSGPPVPIITTTTTVATTTTTTKEHCSADQAQCTECKNGACVSCKDHYTVDTTSGNCFAQCNGQSDPQPARPKTPFDHNGIAWPAMCIEKTEAHFFGIGDWGGDLPDGHTWTNPGKCDGVSEFAEAVELSNQSAEPVDLSQRKCTDEDHYAQKHVAGQMAIRAKRNDPDYVLNAGDNFYPGGYKHTCQSGTAGVDPSHQWAQTFELVYTGEGLDHKPWFSVLGNHDYGGMRFTSGWDSQIFHTWDAPRWILPAQYWSRRVQYKDFAVEYYFLESNVFDAHGPGEDPGHNICSGAPCWGMTADNCRAKLDESWTASIDMVKQGVEKSTAEWHILVTHFPPAQIIGNQQITDLHDKYGIDLIFTGHSHMQSHDVDPKTRIAWIISGGGGGATTDGTPRKDGNDDAYGFIDFTITRTSLKFEMISHTGQIRRTVTLEPHKKTPPASTATEVVI